MRYLPNLLCMVRLVLTPFCVRAIVMHRFEDAFWLFAAAGITDFLDGYLARRFQWQSAAGALLDPLADKVLMAATYLAMCYAAIVPWWLVMLVFGRDLLIVIGAAVAARFTAVRKFPPSLLGKLSTTIQLIAAALILLAGAGWFPQAVVMPAVAAIALGTIASGLDYLVRGVAIFRSSAA